MEHLEKENIKMGVEENAEVKKFNKIKAHHILSTDQEYKGKCMFDSVKEKKSKIQFLSFGAQSLWALSINYTV